MVFNYYKSWQLYFFASYWINFPLGNGELVANNTLTRANENRFHHIYEEFAMLPIKQVEHLYLGNDILEVQLKHHAFALDATTIDLCLSAF